MRVLSIDGGGIRGIIPALVLAEVERRAGRRVFELFDLIAGTSTGGILACALCAPDPLPAAEVVALYEQEGPRIFDRSVWQRIRSAEGLLAALGRAEPRERRPRRRQRGQPAPAARVGRGADRRALRRDRRGNRRAWHFGGGILPSADRIAATVRAKLSA